MDSFKFRSWLHFLGLLGLAACRSAEAPFDDDYRTLATNYCADIRFVFEHASAETLNPKIRNKTTLYRESLVGAVTALSPDPQVRRERLASIKDADPTNLDDCSDLTDLDAKIEQTTFYHGDIPKHHSPRRIFVEFLKALAKKLDAASFYQEPSDNLGSSNFGVLLDLNRIKFLNLSPDTVKVLATDPKQRTLQAGDEIESIRIPDSEALRFEGDKSEISVNEYLQKYPVDDFAQLFNRSYFKKLFVEYRRSGSENTESLLDATVLPKTPLLSIESSQNIIYVQIPTFFVEGIHTDLRSQLKSEISRLEANGIKRENIGIILDLRYNPGGFFLEAMRVASLFLDHGRVGTQRTRHAILPTEVLTKRAEFTEDLIVLINRYTLSSAEALALTLAETERALTFGQRSFGKGIGQTTIHLDSLGGDFGFTSYQIYGPLGRSIHKRGLSPMIAVSDPEEDTAMETIEARIFWDKLVDDRDHWLKGVEKISHSSSTLPAGPKPTYDFERALRLTETYVGAPGEDRIRRVAEEFLRTQPISP